MMSVVLVGRRAMLEQRVAGTWEVIVAWVAAWAVAVAAAWVGLVAMAAVRWLTPLAAVGVEVRVSL